MKLRLVSIGYISWIHGENATNVNLWTNRTLALCLDGERRRERGGVDGWNILFFFFFYNLGCPGMRTSTNPMGSVHHTLGCFPIRIRVNRWLFTKGCGSKGIVCTQEVLNLGSWREHTSKTKTFTTWANPLKISIFYEPSPWLSSHLSPSPSVPDTSQLLWHIKVGIPNTVSDRVVDVYGWLL